MGFAGWRFRIWLLFLGTSVSFHDRDTLFDDMITIVFALTLAQGYALPSRLAAIARRRPGGLVRMQAQARASTANYHINKYCNMKCNFCYATFDDVLSDTGVSPM